jgi:hypothetical protein
MLRVLIQTCVCLCLLAGTALAQDRLGVPLNPKRPLTPEEAAKRKASDEAYQAAINKIPDKKSSADPWGTIRPASPAPKNKPQQ